MSEYVDGPAQEQLLQAWLDMSLMIRGNRLITGFSLNEMVICRILYERREQGGEAVTATELCRRMQLLKSQINKILTTMEKDGTIERVRSESDRRKIEIHLREEGLRRYVDEHERILQIIGHVRSRLGAAQADQLTRLMNETVKAVREMPAAESPMEKE